MALVRMEIEIWGFSEACAVLWPRYLERIMQSVLVVEDNAEVRRLFETALQQAGYRVYPAASPGEGYEVLRRTRVDMVLTDLNMPLGAGMELVSIVRQEFPTTKILGVSAEASEFNPMQAAPILENVEVLPNPIGVHDLVATVQRVLQTP